MKNIVEAGSFILIIGGSFVFGIMGRPVEMGLAIVGGAISLSLANLEKFRKIKGAGFEAELIHKIEAVIEKETEVDISGEESKPVPAVSKIDRNTKAVINALRHHQYTWRYSGGIRKDTNLDAQQVNDSLKWLQDNGYVSQSLGKHGTIWNLTDDGRYLHTVIAFEKVQPLAKS